MTTPLTLDTARGSDGKFVLVVEGEIDLSNIDAFNQALAGAANQATGSEEALLVDISAVEYLDSAAISALASQADRIELLANPILMSVLRISGLSELTKVEPAPPRQ
ncbi:anti-anti-sigma factor [Mycobacterium sp. 1165196.3]|uniref:Anti-sigma factor antagonist n=1 Tax=Mycobacterium colombiense TaxID=339268 RepID=A0A329KBD8_9MYCO|nr:MULTISPECIES: STAS domain-containing protein [Mycobacterium]OBJ03886.1 anti-anti-sigma factor [Mycobacterium sp. 1482292.6]OBJ26888.1 anti-anti-sigma factor [Mycobacterium sp. 1245801.1]OBK15634.1 anti-anti-sigma factor [Mycobacterium sp. 1245852.3]OBK36348.1 anti-anti-sigma factor [Mycobacterium sp. 1165196.3]OBL15641.1 anti-anti-sigma factor [Mycobacterium sp. 1245499.0]